MPILYYSPGACSLAVHIALIENKVQFTLKKVSLTTHQTEDGINITDIHTKGYVPILVLDNGVILTEVAAILLYIADQNPNSFSASHTPELARYKLQEWLIFIATEMHKAYGPFFDKRTPEEYRIIAREKLSKRLAYLDTTLKDKLFLLDEQFSVADAYCFTILRWVKFVKTGVNIESWPNINLYFDKLEQQPAIQLALSTEDLRH